MIYSKNLPQVRENAQIGLLGGSFDPPHLGHSLLALSFLALEPIDELWIIPCQNHAFKGEISSFYHRIRMCELAFKRINQVSVLDIESFIAAPNYTLKTLDYILSRRPDLKLSFAIGSDLVGSFHKWHQAEAVAKKTSIVIFERQNYLVKDLPAILKTARIHQGYCLPDTNSTEIRASLKSNQQYHFIDQEVREYIKEFKLYG